MPDADAPEITNTRRILAVSLEDEANHLSRVLKGDALTRPDAPHLPLPLWNFVQILIRQGNRSHKFSSRANINNARGHNT